MYIDNNIPFEEIGTIRALCDDLKKFEASYAKFENQETHLFRCVILCRYHDWMADYVRDYLYRNEEINCVDGNGWSLLHHVCNFPLGKKCLDMVEVLIEAGIDTALQAKGTGLTALHLCVLTLNDDYGEQIAKALIDEGNCMDIKERRGWNVLHIISSNIAFNADYGRKLVIVQYLIDMGIDINAVDKDGRTALHILSEWICIGRIEEMISILVVNGANYDLKDRWNRRAVSLWR